MLVEVAALPTGVEPDWPAIERAVIDLPVEVITGGELAEFSGFELEPDAGLVTWGCRAAWEHVSLSAQLDTVREALEVGDDELAVVPAGNWTIFLTGGPSAGEDPTSLFDPLWRLNATGVLSAGGFAPGVGRPGRAGPSRPLDVRRTRAGRLLGSLSANRACGSGTFTGPWALIAEQLTASLPPDVEGLALALDARAAPPEVTEDQFQPSATLGVGTPPTDELDVEAIERWLYALSDALAGIESSLFTVSQAPTGSMIDRAARADELLEIVVAEDGAVLPEPDEDGRVVEQALRTSSYRWSTTVGVEGQTLLVSQSHGRDGPDVAASVVRLGRAGVLDGRYGLTWFPSRRSTAAIG